MGADRSKGWNSFMRPLIANQWNDLRRRARLRLLQMHYDNKIGHIGGNLSCLDLLLCLHHHVITPNDQFILSKGHAAGALYVTLWSLGKLTDQELRTFHKDNTRLSAHPPANAIPQIGFGTGSLGHGLSLAAGLALGKLLKHEPGRVFCLMSDGEWNEGSCWEALIFARHHCLENLTLVVDLNGLQGFGSTQEVADIEPLAEKLRTFKVFSQEIDGHDPAAICQALATDRPGPDAIVAHTHKGKGISFMQDRMEWHYLPMTEEHYRLATQEVEAACEMSSASL